MENFKLKLTTAFLMAIGYAVTITFFYFGFVVGLTWAANFFIFGAWMTVFTTVLSLAGTTDPETLENLTIHRNKLGPVFTWFTGTLNLIKNIGFLGFFIATGHWVIAALGFFALIGSALLTTIVKTATKVYNKNN